MTKEKKTTFELDENQMVILLMAMIEAKSHNKDWGQRSDKRELYSFLLNQYKDMVEEA